MPALAPSSFTLDDIDDLLYLTRANETAELQQTIADLVQRHSCTPGEVILSGVDPESGNTVLHYASANGFTVLLQSFFAQLSDVTVEAIPAQSGAEPPTTFVNRQNEQGNTALHWAAYNGHLDVVKVLLDAGADMWIKNAAGHLAMFEAERAEKNEVVQHLLQVGGDSVAGNVAETEAAPEDIDAEAAADLADANEGYAQQNGVTSATTNGSG